MDFSEFGLKLYPLIGGDLKGLAEFFDRLISFGIQDETGNNDLLSMSVQHKRRLLEGEDPFSSFARKYISVFDTLVFANSLSGYCSDDMAERVAKAFASSIPDINANNYDQKIAELFSKIIEDSAKDYRSKTRVMTKRLLIPLFQEADGHCPCCGKSLTLSGDGRVCPVRLSKKDSDDSKSFIGLCPSCANKAESGILSRISLQKTKSKLLEKRSVYENLFDISLDQKVLNAIEVLMKTSENFDEKPNYKGLKVSQKIDREKNPGLYKKISSYVAAYYPTLKEALSSLDGDGYHSYRKLASSINASFLGAAEKSENRELIFDALVEKIMALVNCERVVGEIVVSFFVENCEVFDEIP